MRIWLYLSEQSFADTWVGGGSIPVSPASVYKSIERQGIYTPDEDTQRARPAGLSDDELQRLGIKIGPSRGTINFTDCGNEYETFSGTWKWYDENSYILSFSNLFSSSLMKRLGKSCAIEIASVSDLQKILNPQIGAISVAGLVKYTNNEERNHFLKSVADSWQREFRISWPMDTNGIRWVTVPPGTGIYVDSAALARTL